MYQLKDSAQNLKAAARRRRRLLIITPILFLIAALVALQYIEPKYESSTTILVQKDETLNPLVMYEMAVSIASEDRLNSLNEIIYSRSTMEILIDSLKLDEKIRSEAERQQLIESTQNSITTRSRGSDSFEISFINTDPQRAKLGAELLTNHFINSRIRLETRRHEETVNFFSTKLEEIESIVNQQRNQTMAATSDIMREMPSSTAALQDRLRAIEEQLDAIEWSLIQEEEKLATLEQFQNADELNEGIRHLFRLPLSDTQFGDELSTLLNEYESTRQQFTDSFPRVRSLALQIQDVANRIPPTLDSNIQRLTTQKNDLSQQRQRVVNEMQQYFVASQRASSQQSDFSIYEGLQADMKVKLEQAKMTRDIGQRAADQFIVLDAAHIPEKPTSPNKRLIIGIALFVGLIMGVALSAFAEVMDTTLRYDTDVPYQKPVIAYLT